MINSITLLGSASGRNAGDAALMSSIMDGVDEACGTQLLYDIPTLNTKFVRETYHNRVRPVGILPWNLSLKLFGLPTYNSLMRTDMSLIFDATLFDRALYNPYFNFLSSFDALLPSARRRGKKMACYTVTVGPVRTQGGKDMLRRVMEMMDFITVRDDDSIRELQEAKVQNPNVLITNDAALNTKAASPERVQQILNTIGVMPGREILALNINPYFDTWAGLGRKPLSQEQFVSEYVSGVKKAVANIDADLLFVATQHLDVKLTREIMERLDVPHRKLYFSNTEYSHHDIKGVMAHASLLFAMRLHCLILTSSALTPICSLDYLPKVTTYLKSLGLASYSMGFEAFSANEVASHLEKSWAKRHEIRSVLQGCIPRMQREANMAAELVAAMRNGQDAGKTIQHLKAREASEPQRVGL